MSRFSSFGLGVLLQLCVGSFVSCVQTHKHVASFDETQKALDHTEFSASDLDYQVKNDLERGQEGLEVEHPQFSLGDWLEHPEVVTWIAYFDGPGRRGLLKQLKVGEPYRPMIEAVLKEKKLPTDFYFVALIESGFVNTARSSASAVGMWQFMKGTGKRYGLRVNSYVDERRDPIRATAAAATYLSDLNRVFQSWFLALAAYSSGEGRVLNTIMNKGERDYWKIIRLKGLPRETRDYVPKFIAAAWVGRKLQNEYAKELSPMRMPALHGVKMSSGIPLAAAAKEVGLALSDLKRINPHLVREIIPPGSSSYTLWLPKKLVNQDLEIALLKLKPRQFQGRGALMSPGLYKIKRGDSLYSIARRFETTVKALVDLNQLKTNRLVAGKTIYLSASEAKVTKKTATSLTGIRYQVKLGDTLGKIARRHKLSLREIKKYNQMIVGNKIFPGQVLDLPAT